MNPSHPGEINALMISLVMFSLGMGMSSVFLEVPCDLINDSVGFLNPNKTRTEIRMRRRSIETMSIFHMRGVEFGVVCPDIAFFFSFFIFFLE
jgi:hypothetical protein